MEAPGRVLDEKVTLRVEFIGWANAPEVYEDSFLVVDQDMDWLTIGRAAMFRIHLSDDLRLIVAAQTALGIALSSGDLDLEDPQFRDCDGNWVNSVDSYAFGTVHEVSNVGSERHLHAAVLKEPNAQNERGQLEREKLSAAQWRAELRERRRLAALAGQPSDSESDCESEKAEGPKDGRM